MYKPRNIAHLQTIVRSALAITRFGCILTLATECRANGQRRNPNRKAETMSTLACSAVSTVHRAGRAIGGGALYHVRRGTTLTHTVVCTLGCWIVQPIDLAFEARNRGRMRAFECYDTASEAFAAAGLVGVGVDGVAPAASASPWPTFAGVSIQSAPAKRAAVAPVSITVRRPDGMIATATPTPETRPLVMGRIGASHPIPVADASFDVESFEVIDANGGRPLVVTPQGVSRKPRKARAPKAGYRGPKVMQSRYDGFCWGCRERFDAGAWVAYDGNAKRCIGCADCSREVFEAQKAARPAKQA